MSKGRYMLTWISSNWPGLVYFGGALVLWFIIIWFLVVKHALEKETTIGEVIFGAITWCVFGAIASLFWPFLLPLALLGIAAAPLSGVLEETESECM